MAREVAGSGRQRGDALADTRQRIQRLEDLRCVYIEARVRPGTAGPLIEVRQLIAPVDLELAALRHARQSMFRETAAAASAGRWTSDI